MSQAPITPMMYGIPGACVALGLNTPSSRFVAAAVPTAVALYMLKAPKMFFREDGSIRPLVGTSSEEDATPFHFLMAPILAGAAFSVLV